MARRRRRFLLLLLALWWLVLLLPFPGRLSAQPAAGPGTEIRGVWITANDMGTLRDRERMKAAVRQLAALNFNTLYPVVWNNGFAYYPSAVSEGRGLQHFTYRGLQGQDILAELIEEAHRQGLQVMPWFEFGFMTPPGSTVVQRHPDWLTQRRDGSRTSISAAGEVAWMNPVHPQVQQLITDLVLEIVGTYDVDGIQFDDHMSLPRDFGYDPYTVALYQRDPPPKDPKAPKRVVPTDPQDAAWVRWRADRITAFLARLQQAVQARRAGVILSISPNYYDFAYKLQLQDWLAWVRQGLVGEVVIQIYRPDLESFVPQLDRPEVRESLAKVPTGIGVMSGQRNRPAPMALIQAQVQEARQRQLGVAFFYLESLWELSDEPKDSRLAGLSQLFATPAPRPRLVRAAPAWPSTPPPLPPPPPGG
ncbi:MAG: glycoside hydrolase family 10 protein [Synechococcus sp.]